MKRSDLIKLIESIVKSVIDEIEMEEQSTTGAASPVTMPIAFKKKKTMEEDTIDEMTTTSGGGGSTAGTPGYNIPGAFSDKGGSKKGVEGSEKLGYTLTPIGRKEMKLKADRLYENINPENINIIQNKINQILAGKDDVKRVDFSKMLSHQPQITFDSGDVWPMDWNEFIHFIGEYGKLIGKI